MRRSGFTLIEILVVITIVGVMIAGALLSLGVVGVDRGYARDAERMRAMLEYLRDRAELEGREYGVMLDLEGYRFVVYDSVRQDWTLTEETSLQPTRWQGEHGVELSVDGRAVVLPSRRTDSQSLRPQFGVDGLGEFSSFALRWRGAAPDARIELELDARGALILKDLESR